MLVSAFCCSVQDLATFGVFLGQNVISDHFVASFFFELMLMGFKNVKIPIFNWFFYFYIRWSRGFIVGVERTVEGSGEIRFSILHVSKIFIVKIFNIWYVKLSQICGFFSFLFEVFHYILVRKFLFDRLLVFRSIYFICSLA